MKQRLSKHQTTGKWLDRKFMEKQMPHVEFRFQSVLKNDKKEDLNN